MGKISVSFSGDFNRVQRLLDPDHWQNVLEKEVPDMIENDAGPRIADNIRNVISSGSAGGPELSAQTIARKGSSTKLYDSGAMAAAVGVKRVDEQTVFVGVLSGEGSHNGVDLADLAAMHEAGTSQMPARPFMASAEDAVPDILAGALSNLFSSAGFWSNF
jgi:phage gpG-like protein